MIATISASLIALAPALYGAWAIRRVAKRDLADGKPPDPNRWQMVVLFAVLAFGFGLYQGVAADRQLQAAEHEKRCIRNLARQELLDSVRGLAEAFAWAMPPVEGPEIGRAHV